jgi:undecaprenyl-diphosphatase
MPVLTQVMIFFSFLGSGLFLTLLGIAICAYLLYIKWKREAVLFLITNVGELMLNIGLKAFYKRQRPEPLFDYALPSSYSFPSGHALGSFCFYAILAWIIVRNVENPATKWAIAIGSVVMIFTIGISRIYLGVHYPSDVVAGYVCAAVWTTTVIFSDRSLLKESRPEPSPG